jgi:two-component system sensor histidine kinase MprB
VRLAGRPRGLRGRLTLAVAGLLALALGAAFVAAWFVVRKELRRELDSSLRTRAAAFAAFRPNAPRPDLRRVPRRVAPPGLGESGGYVQFVDSTGEVVLPGGEHVRLPTAGAAAVAAGARQAFFGEATVAGTHVRIYTTRFRAGTALQIARPLTEIDSVLSRLQLLFLAVSLVTLLGGAAAALLGLRAMVRPVRRLTEHAERIAATGDLGERTDATRADELGRLALAFNTMLDALAESVRAQRQLVADASHELRTPLAAARTNLEVLELHEDVPADERARILGEAIEELREMTRLIEELVELARGDAAVLETQPTRLDLLVEEAVAVAERRSGRRFETSLVPAVVEASPAALGRAVSNLLDNAVKWGPPDAPIEVEVGDGAVRVRDHGPGIDPADAPHVFDRFYRAAAARSLPGSGLGLAIVRQVAEAHGGSVAVEPAASGGSVFTLRLAASATPAPDLEPQPA